MLRSSPLFLLQSRRALGFVILSALAAGCARSDEEWLARLEHRDPFERALAALALCEQAPERAGRAVPVLLETVDRAELGLEEPAAAALARAAPALAPELARELGREALMTQDRRQVVMRALVAAGPAAVGPLVAEMLGEGREQAGELGAALVAIGAPAAPGLAELLVRAQDAELASHAAWLLGRLGPRAEAARPTLALAAEEHPHPSVRAAAREALSQLGPAAREPLGPRPER